MSRRKNMLSCIIVSLMLLQLLPLSSFAAYEINSGYCGGEGDGKNLSWTLKDGTLTVSGTGMMESYQGSLLKWCWDLSRIQNVVISEGVTSIGNNAFSNCENIRSVQFSKSLSSIGSNAFYGCYKLGNIEIPKNVTYIGEHAFDSCPNIIYAKLPPQVKNETWNAFSNCNGLVEAVVPSGVKEVSLSAYEDSNSLKTVMLSAGVDTIGSRCFWHCDNLKEVYIPVSLTKIEYDAFDMCSILSDVYYSGSEEQWRAISIETGNDYLLNATIHFNFNGSPQAESKIEPFSGTATFTIGTGSRDTTISNVKWDDSWFIRSATEYNHELARTSMALAAAAYVKSSSNMEAALMQFGFPMNGDDSTIEFKYITPSKDNNDTISFSLATKHIPNENGNPVTLVLIDIKGTSSDAEWYSNFNIGTSNPVHLGFLRAYSSIVDELNVYIPKMKEMGYTFDSNTRFLVTGHSRGAAVANLVAAYLTVREEYNPNNIYGYTFATPTVATTAKQYGYENIFNIVNAEDFVTQVPLRRWGYNRFGVDKPLPSKSYYKIIRSGETVKVDTDQTIYDGLFSKVSKQYQSLTGNELAPYPSGTITVLRLTEKVYSLAPNVSDYYNKKHTRLYGMPANYTCANFFDNLAAIIVDNKGIPDFLVATMNGDFQALADFFIINHNAVPEGIPVIGDWLDNQTTINMPRLMGTHSPAAYLSWLTCSENELFQFEHKYKESLIDCPVDVYVYDENNSLVASIENEEVVVNKLAVYVQDGTKVIHMPSDQEYRLEIHATDSGSVDYAVKEYSIDKTNETVRTVDFDEIEIQNGDSLAGAVNEITYTDFSNYALTKNNTERIMPGDDSHNCACLNFKDVDLSKWYHEGIDYAVLNGMMNGVGNCSFSPDSTTTRAMVVTILHRLEGLPTAKAAKFGDIESGSWYADAVSWAFANGIVSGTSSTTFDPNSPVTREQLATILYRYANYKKCDTNGKINLSQYKDSADIENYAKDGVSWAVHAGLVNGVANNTLAPTGKATRAQVATILLRFSERVAG